jgi:hypothetical protein
MTGKNVSDHRFDLGATLRKTENSKSRLATSHDILRKYGVAPTQLVSPKLARFVTFAIAVSCASFGISVERYALYVMVEFSPVMVTMVLILLPSTVAMASD